MCLKVSGCEIAVQSSYPLKMAVNIDLDWQGWFVVATLACAFLIMAFDQVNTLDEMAYVVPMINSTIISLTRFSLQAGPDLVFTILLAIYTTAGIVPGEKTSDMSNEVT